MEIGVEICFLCKIQELIGNNFYLLNVEACVSLEAIFFKKLLQTVALVKDFRQRSVNLHYLCEIKKHFFKEKNQRVKKNMVKIECVECVKELHLKLLNSGYIVLSLKHINFERNIFPRICIYWDAKINKKMCDIILLEMFTKSRLGFYFQSTWAEILF